MWLKLLTAVLLGVLIVLSWLPESVSQYWFFRVFAYLRVQLAVALVILCAALLLQQPERAYYALIVIGLITTVYHIKQILPFTPIVKKDIGDVPHSQSVRDELKLLIWNVYEPNENKEKLAPLVRSSGAEVVLLLETDSGWERAAQALYDDFPHRLVRPQPNTYGIILLSKLPFTKGEVRYLVEDDVPSVRCTLALANGTQVEFFGLHPRPPVPGESTSTEEKDYELLLVAREVVKQKMPVIVCGDLNDVAWSRATKAFNTLSGLYDPRRGRRLLPTFHARVPGMRFALDHLFCSGHFKLKELHRKDHFGSDHFPVYAHLVIPEINEQQPKDPAAPQEKKAASDTLAGAL